eukprot:gene1944-5891_t
MMIHCMKLPALLQDHFIEFLLRFDILDDLPPFMQDKVTLCIKRKIVSRVPLFAAASDKE